MSKDLIKKIESSLSSRLDENRIFLVDTKGIKTLKKTNKIKQFHIKIIDSQKEINNQTKGEEYAKGFYEIKIPNEKLYVFDTLDMKEPTKFIDSFIIQTLYPNGYETNSIFAFFKGHYVRIKSFSNNLKILPWIVDLAESVPYHPDYLDA